jgi:hypothetical protein
MDENPGAVVQTAAGALHFESWPRLDSRQAFEIATQIVRKDDGAATAFHGTQRARPNRLIESRPTGTRDRASFGDAVGKR